MKRVVLLFPNTSAISDFLVNERVSKAQVNSTDKTVTSVLTDKQITVAETLYQAMVKKMTSN
jgi:hypothetical protein